MQASKQDTQPVYFSQADEQSLSGPLMLKLVSDVLARGLPFRFRAGGSSMFPFIRDGDVISIVPLQSDSPVLGEVAAFRQVDTGRLVVHRVLRNTQSGWILKGDNYPAGQLDGPVRMENLVGIVSRVERNGRQIRLGFGIERLAIAVLSRFGLLRPFVQFAVAVYRQRKKFRFHNIQPTKSAEQ